MVGYLRACSAPCPDYEWIETHPTDIRERSRTMMMGWVYHVWNYFDLVNNVMTHHLPLRPSPVPMVPDVPTLTLMEIPKDQSSHGGPSLWFPKDELAP